jgi:hypothetical protein
MYDIFNLDEAQDDGLHDVQDLVLWKTPHMTKSVPEAALCTRHDHEETFAVCIQTRVVDRDNVVELPPHEGVDNLDLTTASCGSIDLEALDSHRAAVQGRSFVDLPKPPSLS